MTPKRAGTEDALAKAILKTGKWKGLSWMVLMGPMDSPNGYVEVSKGHPLFERNYSDSLCGHDGCYKHTLEHLIYVHGGLTFSGTWGKKGAWWFGFDTGHSFDDSRYGGITKDVAYVENECKKLAEQLADFSVQPHDAEGQRVLKEIEAKVEDWAKVFVSKDHDWRECAETDHEGLFTQGYLKASKNILAIIHEASQSEAQPLTREDKEAEDACPAHGPKCNPHPDCIDNPNCSCHAEGLEAVTREGAAAEGEA